MTIDPRPVFPLNSMRRLCLLLRVPERELRDLADRAAAHYASFDVYKGDRPDGTSKGWRHIDNPNRALKAVQQRIYNSLLKSVAPTLPGYLTGGMPGRSILDNARPHINQPVVVALDVKNCFPSIPYKRVFAVWRNDLGCSDDVAMVLTKLTTHHGHLPQGATTSPMLCNLALRPMAAEVFEYTQSVNLKFTIYVDDMTISGDRESTRGAISVIMPLVRRHGYIIGRGKNTIMDANEIQRTTGLMVNNRLTIPRSKMQALIREVQRVGSLGHAATTYDLNKLWGHIEFVKSVDEAKGQKLTQLAEQLVGDITGKYVKRRQQRTRKCKNIHANHMSM